MCHPIWLLSRKYGTVWYHPASFKFWYLTALSFVNFQEKLTGTSFTLCACEASFVRLAVCLALGARFASTGMTGGTPRSATAGRRRGAERRAVRAGWAENASGLGGCMRGQAVADGPQCELGRSASCCRCCWARLGWQAEKGRG
jgi:hypothetical protein